MGRYSTFRFPTSYPKPPLSYWVPPHRLDLSSIQEEKMHLVKGDVIDGIFIRHLLGGLLHNSQARLVNVTIGREEENVTGRYEFI